MIWSLTLAWLPRAGANSKPHDYKQKVQKMKGLPKTLVLTEKQFEDKSVLYGPIVIGRNFKKKSGKLYAFCKGEKERGTAK